MTSGEILSLLMAKHDDSVCVPECKTGATWGGHCPRLDLWVMARSWAHPRFIGYEIKIRRSDFVADNKWPAYLDYCREFYFVAPRGLIDTGELPTEAGLLEVSTTGTRLFTTKKAPVRNIVIPDDLYLYILMSRVLIRLEGMDPAMPDGRRAYWEAWLEDRKIDHNVGCKVSKALRERINEEIMEARSENKRLQQELSELAEVRAMLDELGCRSRWDIYGKIRDLKPGVPDQMKRNLECISIRLQQVLSDIEKADAKRAATVAQGELVL